MDTAVLRSAYAGLLDVAADPDLGDADDGGGNADQVLAHLLSVDAAIAAVALGAVAGSRPTFDNRISLDTWNLDRIIAEHAGRADLMDIRQHVDEVVEKATGGADAGGRTAGRCRGFAACNERCVRCT